MPPISTHNRNDKPRGHAKWYWIAWLVLLCVTPIVNSVILPNLRIRQPIDFGRYYMPGIWIVVIAANLYEGSRLISYLRKHHQEKWAELTTVPGFGPGNQNSFRTLPWLFSSDTLGDPVLADMKSDYRWFIVWVVAVFVTLPVFG